MLDTSGADLMREFFVPALSRATFYDRAVGYFSSGWLRAASVGMERFAAGGGRGRWITSPILTESDWDALQTGDAARTDPIMREALERAISDLSKTLRGDTLSALAWMVADEVLTFKLALPRNKLERGNFHDKFGIFTDLDGNRMSFNGSYDSIQGTRNYESIKVFCSWQPSFELLVTADAQRFERLWENTDPNLHVLDLPEAAREQILRLRTEERPYPEPAWKRKCVIGEPAAAYHPVRPRMPPSIVLRDYQEEAITAWLDNDCRGLLEMATGTGKTITALATSVRMYEREGRLAVVIAVPYQHLVDQWRKEAETFGYRSILAYQSKSRWLDELHQQILEYNAGYRSFLSVITTHATFIGDEFQDAIRRLGKGSLLVADEAHHLGAERSRQSYPANVPFRLALSATPDRWFDDTGTSLLRAYFGETVFAFPLEKAIGASLTPYYYHPHLVPLTDEELEGYEELSVKIARLIIREDEQGQQALKMLLLRRAELLNKAGNKLKVLSDLVDEQDRIEQTLFYCAPGQIDDVVRLLGWEKGLQVRRFTAEESPRERKRLLTDFASGDLQALAAMRCLDEGVDVPSTRTAFILASSSNPREFIQRRGRILRKAPGKEFSVVHDLIAVPPSSPGSPTSGAERAIIRGELRRFKEFADLALNKHQALGRIWEVAGRYGLLDF